MKIKKINPRKFKNSGLLNRDPQPSDFLFGAAKGAVEKVVLQADRNYDSFLPVLELQYGKKMESMACVTFSAENCIETIGKRKFNKTWNWSDRFTAKMSGTTANGNYLTAVGDSIRHDGVVSEEDWPFDRDNMTWDQYYAEIPQEIKDKGKVLMLQYEVEYELVFPPNHDQIWNALQYGPVQTTVKYNSPILDDIYQKFVGDTDHAVMIYGGTEGQVFKVFDHYDKSLKKYAWDYNFGMSLLYTMGEIKPMFTKLETQKEIVDYYIRKGIVLGVNEANFAKIQAGDKGLIDRIKNDHYGMFFRPESHGEFYIINE